MEVNENHWLISGFTKVVNDHLATQYPDKEYSIHYNTLDGWFKDLELQGIHYVNRKNGGKIYDELDLHLALYIFYYRKERNYSLDMIFEKIRDEKEVRPFPVEESIDEMPKTYQEMANKIKSELVTEVRKVFNNEVRSIVRNEMEQELKTHYKNLLIEDKLREFDPDKYQEEQEKKQRSLAKELLLQQPLIEQELKEEALKKWNEKPESERFEKKLFGKKEKTADKEKFIQEYVNEHRENRIEMWLESRK